MSSSNPAVSLHTPMGESYLQNLGYAARVFLAALLAVKRVEPQAQPVAPVEAKMSERARLKAILELNCMANDYADTMPNQAAELRYIATHTAYMGRALIH